VGNQSGMGKGRGGVGVSAMRDEWMFILFAACVREMIVEKGRRKREGVSE